MIFRASRLNVMCAIVAMGMVLTAASADAQVGATTGAIVGTVTDNTKGVLPGVSVSARGPALMGVRTVVTEADGGFRLPALPPAPPAPGPPLPVPPAPLTPPTVPVADEPGRPRAHRVATEVFDGRVARLSTPAVAVSRALAPAGRPARTPVTASSSAGSAGSTGSTASTGPTGEPWTPVEVPAPVYVSKPVSHRPPTLPWSMPPAAQDDAVEGHVDLHGDDLHDDLHGGDLHDDLHGGLEDAGRAVAPHEVAAGPIAEAVDRLAAGGVLARFLQLRTLWPFPDEDIKDFVRGAQHAWCAAPRSGSEKKSAVHSQTLPVMSYRP